MLPAVLKHGGPLLKKDKPVSGCRQMEIVEALCSGEEGNRKKASSLLSRLVRRRQDLQSRDFIFIFEYCSRKPDPLFAMETWKLMEAKKIAPSGRCFFLTIQALCKGGYLKEAFNLVSTLEEPSVMNPPLPVYNNLLQACVQLRSLKYANECLTMMEHQAVGKSEITYGLLLKEDLSTVHEIWKECIKRYNPSIMMLGQFIESLTKLKDLESANVALQQMVNVAFQQNLRFVKTNEGKWHHLRLDIPIPWREKLTWKDGEYDHIPINLQSENHKAEEVKASVLSLSQKPVARPAMTLLSRSFNNVLEACASMRNVVLAEQLFSQMQNLGLEQTRFTYKAYIRALVSVKGFHDGLESLKVMQQKNIKPFDSTFAAISVGCSRALELDLAENLLDQIPKCPYAYPYNALLEACDILDKPERAVRVFAKMKKRNVKLDIKTYGALIKLFGNVNARYEEGNLSSQIDVATRISVMEKDMMRHGIEHSHLSMQFMLRALAMEGMIKELKKQFINGNTDLQISNYETVLHSLVKAEETHMAIRVFKNMVSHGFPLSQPIYTTMINCCSIIECYRSACALVSMMIRGGCPLHIRTYTAFMKVLLKFEDFNEALELLDHAISEGIQPDVILYNTILRVADEKGRIDVIELILEHMHQENVRPDSGTIRLVLSAYVNNGFDATAIEALHVLSMRMISEQDDILEEAKLKYEDLIFDEDLDFESQIIEIFKESVNLAEALLFLRWCATLECRISWLPNESLWAKRISSGYASRQSSSWIEESNKIG
ncbi:hypothetical protein RD792_013100 [Penstemon davidsonii]|uniref:PROP1-like PPR domain-containing protein n=1 Tax=Penstemon davidsonii TaxID=160366 RepID=A0ABR0CU05_9LAMI|nr:hypothetical protein RD792_013100 [Penstemon davidsonii]